MLHYQNVNEVSEATGDQTSEIPLTENHHGIGQNFMLPVRLPVLGLHGKKMPSFSMDPPQWASKAFPVLKGNGVPSIATLFPFDSISSC